MFVQVIKGKVSDPKGLRQQSERWRDELRDGATGFLGSTGGIADDGTAVFVARFIDATAAQANSGRPEQQTWWEQTARCFGGEPTFRESTDVSTLFDGGSDEAGFVQVMEGTAHDRRKAEELETPELLERLHAARPDFLGALRVWFPGDQFVEVAYFTDEASARRGEGSDEFAGPQQDFAELFSEMTFIDLRSPVLTAPAPSR